MTRPFASFPLLPVLLVFFLSAGLTFGAQARKQTRTKRPATATRTAVAKKKLAKTSTRLVRTSRGSKGKAQIRSASGKRSSIGKGRKSRFLRASYTRGSRYVAGGPWFEPNFADSTLGDNVDGEDLTVRRAAVEALGPYNGTVVVVDPQTGRILSLVNQKVAFGNGFQPCSTVKIYAALAGLSEGIVSSSIPMNLYGRYSMTLTEALARSNNPYFANIGVQLGYEKIAHYVRQYGLGEKATINVPEETLGTVPPGPPANGGMGMMMSFGEGIRLTPLQLAATISAIANGGTLHYLQYPRSQAEAQRLTPQIKRQLPIQNLLPELTPGLLGATEFGTARRAYNDPASPIFGKTGTCTDRATPTHLGWFGSWNEVGGRKLVVVVLLTGGAAVNGPVASGIAGQVYRNLSQQRYLTSANFLSQATFPSETAR